MKPIELKPIIVDDGDNSDKKIVPIKPVKREFIDKSQKNKNKGKPKKKTIAKRSWYGGQTDVVDKGVILDSTDKLKGTPFSIVVKPDKDGNITLSYLGDDGQPVDDGSIPLPLTKFCGQITALLNVILRNTISTVDNIAHADTSLGAISRAVANMMDSDFNARHTYPAVLMDYLLTDEDVLTENDTAEIEVDYAPPGVYDDELEDIYGHGSSHSKNLGWSPKDKGLLEEGETIDWEMYLNDETSLPVTADDFDVKLKTLCSTLSDELFIVSDSAEENDMDMQALKGFSPSSLYLLICGQEELCNFVDISTNRFVVNILGDSYTDVRTLLCEGIMDFCGISKNLTITNVGPSLDDIDEIIANCIDKAFYNATINDMEL